MQDGSTIPLTIFLNGLATRYMTVIGLVAMFYDHTLTFPAEVALVWRARPSFGRNGFLLNKYLALACLLMNAHLSSGISKNAHSDTTCQHLIMATFVCSVYSIIFGHFLMLLRVAVLWDRQKTILKFLTTAFFATAVATLTMVIMTVIRLAPHIVWHNNVRMCVATQTSPLLTIVWASSLPFDLLAFSLTLYSSLSRPRPGDVGATSVVRQDGACFFCIKTCLDALNTWFAAFGDSHKIMTVTAFVWAMVTLLVNRFLLHIRAAETSDKDTYETFQAAQHLSSPSPLKAYAYAGDVSHPVAPSEPRSEQPRRLTQLYECHGFDHRAVDLESLEGCYIQRESVESRALRRL